MLKETEVGNRNSFKHKLSLLKYEHPVDLPFCFELFPKRYRFLKHPDFWLVQLFVTFVRLLGSDMLKADHLIIATFTHAQMLDHCGYSQRPAKHFHASETK